MYKILILTSWGSALPHVINGYAKALLKLGHEVKVIDVSVFEKKENAALVNQLGQEFMKAVKDFSPDLAVFYGTQGIIDIPESELHLFESMNIPYVSLFYDNPFMYLQQLEADTFSSLKKSNNYFITISDKSYYKQLEEAGFTRIYFLPLATDQDLFDQTDELSGLESYSCDVSFVGSIEENPFSLRSKRQKRLEKFPALNKLFDNIIDIEKTPSSEKIMQKLDEISSQMPWNVFALISRVIYEEASTMYRIGFVSAIEEYKINVYGGKGWAEVKKDNLVYKGYLDYQKEAAFLYRASKINLNVTHPQLRTAINQRIYDASLCGGFILSDYRQDLAEFFKDSIAQYSDVNDLKDKIDYYIKNDKERKEMAQAAKEIVFKKHLWSHRAETLIDFIKS